MTLNVGTLDRIARIIIAIAMIAFALGYIAPGTGWNWLGWVGAAIMAVTSGVGWCPIYRAIGMSTR